MSFIDLTELSEDEDTHYVKRPKHESSVDFIEILDADNSQDSPPKAIEIDCTNDTVPVKKKLPLRNGLSLLMKQAAQTSKTGGVEGIVQFDNFITADMAQGLIKSFESTFKYHSGKSGNYEAVRWGALVDYAGRKATEGSNTPEFLNPIIKKLRDPAAPWASYLRDWVPNEGNICNFIKSRGDNLRDHFDDRLLSGPIIVSIGLLGTATLTFKSFPKSATQPQIDAGLVSPVNSFSNHLPEFSLQLLFGKARYEYTHGIANNNLHTERRMSLVLRQVKVS
eukprot:TRINITY_DN28655_c0_g1_i1.p1 TRINITY_DN28655_c0_g1~~TRINITY_DN28655_c0_g1_i1.p1  ORF type:complete len:280 (+),score=31.38 TRINITY_DN28655_c0_g1_i1:113-952(+)